MQATVEIYIQAQNALYVKKLYTTRADVVEVVMQGQVDELAATFEAPLKEFVQMVKSAKAVIADRATALSNLQAVTPALPFFLPFCFFHFFHFFVVCYFFLMSKKYGGRGKVGSEPSFSLFYSPSVSYPYISGQFWAPTFPFLEPAVI